MPDLPTGTITLLFTDMEGSTRLLRQLGEGYASVLADCRHLLRAAFARYHGYEVDTQGDAFFVAFARATDAMLAAVEAQRRLAAHPWPQGASVRVRMGLHTGEPQRSSEGYIGLDVHHAARIMSAGHGGQILLSQTTCDLVAQTLPDGVGLLDLGEYQLKDLQRPSRLYQLVIAGLPADFPQLRTLDAQLHNLPRQPTPFLGREQEVTTVCALLSQPDGRLVTLTGPGGMGKTRMALQVAAELSDQFADGVFLVPLAPVSDPEQVVPIITQTLGISDLSGQTPLTLLKAALKDKQMLLLLDNFEQVIPAAVHVAELLTPCPRLKVLVTSQIVLHVRAEREFAVPPLSVPNPKRLPDLVTLSQYEAVALFIQRAQAVKSDFSVTNANAPAVACICARLDGVPLAIELAAARVKYFPPQVLLTRLEQGLAVLIGGSRDLPVRQQTLRGAIAWSYHLLSPEEQQLFRRLSVFVDGNSLEAAEQVCSAAGVLDMDILEGLTSLVDKSLLRQAEQGQGEETEARFWMLQTLREFGLEMLVSATESEPTRQAHAEYYLALAQEAEPHLRGAEQARWLARLEREHENLRTALSFLLEHARMQDGTPQAERSAELVLRLSVALCWFWNMRGYWRREGLAFLQQALAQRTANGAGLRARALLAAAELAWALDDEQQAERLCEQSLLLYRQLGDKAGIAGCLFELGATARSRSQYGRARSQLEEAAALYEELGDRWKRGQCFSELARAATEEGQDAEALTWLEESLRLYQSLNDRQRLGWVRYLLARLLFISQQDPARAQRLCEQSLALFRELGDTISSTYPLGLLGWMRLVQGDLAAARSLLEESLEIFKEVEEGGDDSDARICLARLSAMQGDLKTARHLYQHNLALLWKQGTFKEFMARSLEGLAALEAKEGAPGHAAQLWGTAEALREAIGARMYPVDRSDYEQAVAAARTQAGEAAFATAWAEGRRTPLEQVINEAIRMVG